MKKHKQYIIAIVIVIGLATILVSSLKTANTQSNTKTDSNKQETDKSDEHIPLVSLDDFRQTENISENRKKKNEKFDNWSWVRKTFDNDSKSVILINDWQSRISALPVDKSDAVLIGTVNSGEAFLSNDGTGIYSEFSVSVNDVIKNNQKTPIDLGEKIPVQRAGGRLLYPSGKILKYLIAGQEMPKTDGRYVFFLTYDKQRLAYLILTAYEIADGKITALDGRGKSKGGGFAFTEYNGAEEQQFLNELEIRYTLQKNSAKEVKTQ